MRAIFTFGTGGRMTRGMPAIQSYCRTLEDKAAAGTIVEVPEIEALRPFWWLLSKEQVGQIQSMLKTAIAAAPEGGRSSGCATSPHSASKTKVGDAKRKLAAGSADQGEKQADMLELFGK